MQRYTAILYTIQGNPRDIYKGKVIEYRGIYKVMFWIL